MAGICAALHVGKLAAALPVLRDALGVSVLQAGFLLSLVQLAGMSFGVAVGLAADAFGLRRTMLTGLGILAAASALGGLARHPADLLVLRAAEGFGFLLVTMPGPSLIRRLVSPARLDGSLGVWSTFMPIGTALALLAGPVVMAALGWTGLWELLAAVTVAAAILVAAVVPPDPRSHPSAAVRLRWTMRLRETLASRGPWIVALCFAVYSAQWMSVIGFLPTIYSQAGLTARWTALATASAAAVNIIGNVAAGRLLQRGVTPDRLLLAGFAAMGLGAWLAFGPLVSALGPATAAAVRYGAVLMFSAVGGLIPATLFALAVRVAPNEGTVSTTVGWMQQWSCFGQFVGPPLVAWAAHRTGGWEWTWLVTAAFALSGATLAFGARLRLRIAVLKGEERQMRPKIPHAVANLEK
ncbi:MAG: MFS transporter [Pseudomonadota bacterium]|nr:MFS transporter [Pseudomonadota bacterium]